MLQEATRHQRVERPALGHAPLLFLRSPAGFQDSGMSVLRLTGALCGALAILLGSVVLVGWAVHSAVLIQVARVSVPYFGCGSHVAGHRALFHCARRRFRAGANKSTPEKRKGCGAHHQTGLELLRSALRFARVP